MAVHKVKYGNVERMSFSKTKEILDLPYLIELQKSSYKKFLEEGLREIFDEFSPIVQRATNGGERFILEFGEYRVEEPHFSARACRARTSSRTMRLFA